MAPCETGRSDPLLAQLRDIVGASYVLVRDDQTAPYARGYRMGSGDVAAVVRPKTLVELWRAIKACIAADHIIIPQAANTGLTGGSTPSGHYDHPVVIINMMRIRGIRPIRQGTQVVCLAGSSLYDLETLLAPLGREPHSVIGSSCIGASVVGGVCNNSGGALVQRGPAYTQYSLYAQVAEAGKVHLRNHLGIELGEDPLAILAALDEGNFSERDVICDGRPALAADDYAPIVRAINEASPARYNADPRRLFEASGSAGKLVVFAVRLDTFPAPKRSAIFYVGTNDIDELTQLRRRILAECDPLPVSGEYIHREAFDVAARYGKDTVLGIRLLGTSRLPQLFAIKARIDRWAQESRMLPRALADRILQMGARLFPQHLPVRMMNFRDRYQHHLIIKVADDTIDQTRTLLTGMFPSVSGDMFECNLAEGQAAILHRFAVAGAAVRYRNLHVDLVEDVVAIDVALRRNDLDWFERLPEDLAAQVVARLYYGHFFCHVFHQDYLVKKGVDPMAFEHKVLQLIDERGGEYPAEHNVGHLYHAKPTLTEHYRRLDPSNRLNPGIGGTSRSRDYR